MAKYIEERINELEKGIDELKTIVKQLQESNITIDDVKRYFNTETTTSSVEGEINGTQTK